jgi:hypothetical protein
MPSYKELMLKRKKKSDSIQDQLRIEQLSSGKRSSPKPDITEEQLRAALVKKSAKLPPLDTGDYSHIEEGRRESKKDRLANEKSHDDYWGNISRENSRFETGWEIEEAKRRYGQKRYPDSGYEPTNDRIKGGSNEDTGDSTIYRSATKGAVLQLEAMKNELGKIANTEEGLLTSKEIYLKHKDKFDEYFEAEDGMNALQDSYQLDRWSTIDPKRDFWKQQGINPWNEQLAYRGLGKTVGRYPNATGKGHGVMPDAIRKHPFIDKALRRGWIDIKKLDTGRIGELREELFEDYPKQRKKESTPRGYGNALYNKLIKAPLAKHDLGNLKEPPPMPSVVGPKLKIPVPVMPPSPVAPIPIDPRTGLPEGGGGTLKMLKPNKS